MSDIILGASLTLQWILEDESDREYSLKVLASLAEKRAFVPVLWFYEVGNGLLMAFRRKRISFENIEGFLVRLQNLPIDAAEQLPVEILQLPDLANRHSLTSYDAAYLALALRWKLPLATGDRSLRRAATAAGVSIAET